MHPNKQPHDSTYSNKLISIINPLKQLKRALKFNLSNFKNYKLQVIVSLTHSLTNYNNRPNFIVWYIGVKQERNL